MQQGWLMHGYENCENFKQATGMVQEKPSIFYVERV